MTSALSSPECQGPVAITGITGFVGRALAQRLLTAGVAVRGLVRRQDAELPAGIERIIGDLQSPEALDGLITGTSLVVHCAGAVRGRERADFDRVNVAGTGALLARIGQTHPGVRLIHLSSLAARAPHLSHYAASKQAAEALFDDATECRWTLLRPTAIYGPGDKELAPLLASMARGWAPTPAVAGARVTLIHIDDVVDAILAAAASTDSQGGCFELSDAHSEGYGWDELCAAVAALRQRQVRRVPVPVALLTAAGRINLTLAGLFRYAPMLSPGKARELAHPDWSCDYGPFTAASGWQPRIDLASGLASVLGEP
ncbi:MAG: NAD-dependent epimerase/dehydratase family protein [Gammaproteobacteria bacterium]|nr:NAD-dependent epimerase/dehydratase family protein [Gammaproteobacteria bacterium]